VRLGAAVVAVVLVGAWFLTRGDDGEVGTEARPGSTASTPPTTTPAAATPGPTGSNPTPVATTTERPPTLAFRVLRNAYITIRVPGGRTLVSKLFRKGASRTFDQKVLQVVNGRPSAVRFTVNGEPRKPGAADETEVFTVRRKG
jgi:hypothetical protein